MLMRAEAYTYPLRVNKTTQENVEPLELHYRVHVYAMKQIFALENVKPFEKRIEKLKIIRYYLRLFLGHFIFAKKNLPPLPAIETKLPFIDSTPPWDFEDQPEIVDEGEEYYDDAIQDTLELMITFTDLRVECIEYCRRAFETIVKRFPHYKSYYQLALLHLINHEFQQGMDIIFVKLFKGKFVSFEKVTDIERTDIERSDTLAYHIKKLIRLTLALLKKCQDIPKTNAILEDLVKESSSGRMKLKPDERMKFLSTCIQLYHDATVKAIKTKNIDQINTLIKFLEKASTILRK
uniref:Uncharacterized protein n=1 Tax=Panagrolaimus davidi TaxID=227884 RepID=A0A914QQK4_9BILA